MSKTDSPSKPVIHRQMTIEQILSLFPHKAQRLSQEITNAGLHCVGCHAATWETLEAGMLGHGMAEEAIERLVRRLNALLEEEEADPTSITMTKRAASKYMEILAEEGKQGWGLRFGDKMAGCNGFEYILDYSEKAESDDEVFESHGLQIHVNKSNLKRLLGSEIDYVDGLHGSGFKISNPHARSSCGCGTSHNY
jgi:iron-sulfur cluster assembly accessory protein